MEPVLIWGASGHAQVVAEALELGGLYSVAGYIDDVNPGRKGEMFEGAPIIGGREDLAAAAGSLAGRFIVAIGSCIKRKEACEFGLGLGLGLVNAIHPSAAISRSARLSSGIVCSAGTIVCPHARVEQGAIINTGASVDHGSVIGAYAHIAPGARLAGDVIVEECAWVGIGAVVKEKIRIGTHAVVGAGAVVIRDVSGGSVVYGVPARARI